MHITTTAMAVEPSDNTRSMPDEVLNGYVNLCIQWLEHLASTTGHTTWSTQDCLTVGLALRDEDLLKGRGFSIAEAFQAIPWPYGLDLIRKEVLWRENEKLRRKLLKDRIDPFDSADPSKARSKSHFDSAWEVSVAPAQ